MTEYLVQEASNRWRANGSVLDGLCLATRKNGEEIEDAWSREGGGAEQRGRDGGERDKLSVL